MGITVVHQNDISCSTNGWFQMTKTHIIHKRKAGFMRACQAVYPSLHIDCESLDDVLHQELLQIIVLFVQWSNCWWKWCSLHSCAVLWNDTRVLPFRSFNRWEVFASRGSLYWEGVTAEALNSSTVPSFRIRSSNGAMAFFLRWSW